MGPGLVDSGITEASGRGLSLGLQLLNHKLQREMVAQRYRELAQYRQQNLDDRKERAGVQADLAQQRIDNQAQQFQDKQDAANSAKAAQADAATADYQNELGNFDNTAQGNLGNVAQQYNDVPSGGMMPPQPVGAMMGGAQQLPPNMLTPEQFSQLHPIDQRQRLGELRKARAHTQAAVAQYQSRQDKLDQMLQNGAITPAIHDRLSNDNLMSMPDAALAHEFAKQTQPQFDPNAVRNDLGAAGLDPNAADAGAQAATLAHYGVRGNAAQGVLDPTHGQIDPQWLADAHNPDPSVSGPAQANLLNARRNAGFKDVIGMSSQRSAIDPTMRAEQSRLTSIASIAQRHVAALQFSGDEHAKASAAQSYEQAVNALEQFNTHAAAPQQPTAPAAAPQSNPAASAFLQQQMGGAPAQAPTQPAPAPAQPQAQATPSADPREAALATFQAKHQRMPNPDDPNDVAEIDAMTPQPGNRAP